VAGILLTISLIPYFARCWREQKFANRAGWILLTLGAVLGLVLVKIGTPHRLKYWLYAHIGLCAAGVFVLALAWTANRKWMGGGPGRGVFVVRERLGRDRRGKWGRGGGEKFWVEECLLWGAPAVDDRYDGRRRRRTRGKVFPEFGANARRRKYSREIFYAV